MVAAKVITWEEASAPEFETTTRRVWREAVTEIAEKAKATLPEANGRVDKAVALVLAGDVELLEGGKAKVASQSNGATVYHIVNGECPCKDFPKSPSGWCKHRIAAGIQKRALALVQKKLAGTNGHAEAPSQPAQVQALPEAPVSITLKASLHGHEVLVTLRGVDFASVKAQVEQASQWLTSQAPAQPATPGDGWCSKHGAAMQLNHGKNGSTWYSHKTPSGWCKGR